MILFRLSFVCALLFFSGCVGGSPGLGFGHAPYSTVEVDGNTYRVYTEEVRDCVEVHRANFVFPPPSAYEVRLQTEIAVKKVTGCSIRSGTLVGDVAMSKAQLDCSNGTPRKDWVAGTCNVTWRGARQF